MKKLIVIHKKENKNTAKNFIICTFLHSYRQVSPNFARKKQAFFKKYEPLFKEKCKGAVQVGVIFEGKEDEVRVFNSLEEIPDEKILSWGIVKEPDRVIYFYTKSIHRRKSLASKIFKALKDCFVSDEIIMEFFTGQGWSLLNSKKALTNTNYKIYIE